MAAGLGGNMQQPVEAAGAMAVVASTAKFLRDRGQQRNMQAEKHARGPTETWNSEDCDYGQAEGGGEHERHRSNGRLVITGPTGFNDPGRLMTLGDADSLMSRAFKVRQHEVVADGFASIRQAMGKGKADLTNRMGNMTSSKVCTIHKLLIEEMQESMMLEIGWMANMFHTWRSQAVIARMEKKLRGERERHEVHATQAAEHATRLESKLHQSSQMMLAQWANGDAANLVNNVVRSWHIVATNLRVQRSQDKRLQKFAHTGQGMLLKWFEGNTTGLIHTCFLNWKAEAEAAKQSKAQQNKLEAMLADKNREHDDQLAKMTGEQDAVKARARKATEAMLRQWLGGGTAGLLSNVLTEWARLKDAEKELSRRRQTVHIAMLRFFEGDRAATAHACFLNWKKEMELQRILKIEKAEQNSAIVQLENRTKELLGKEQARLLKYSQMLQGSDSGFSLNMIVVRWRMQAQHTLAGDADRRLEMHLHEQKENAQLNETIKRQHAAATLKLMGAKDDGMLVLDMFLAWARTYQADRQKRTHSLVQNKMSNQIAQQMFKNITMQDSGSLLAMCLVELHRHARTERHEREREKSNAWIENSGKTIRQLTEERDELRDELDKSYSHCVNITEKYNLEVKSKEALGTELESVYRDRQTWLQTGRRQDKDSRSPPAEATPMIGQLRQLPHLLEDSWKDEY